MKRTIKFRAWDKSEQKWDDTPESFRIRMINDLKHIEFSQFTGLTDKNGKEIYEGDIIEWVDELGESDRIHRMEVQFKNGGFHPFQVNRDFEVIGNIYENPELI